jgi:hypothetical protein
VQSVSAAQTELNVGQEESNGAGLFISRISATSLYSVDGTNKCETGGMFGEVVVAYLCCPNTRDSTGINDTMANVREKTACSCRNLNRFIVRMRIRSQFTRHYMCCIDTHAHRQYTVRLQGNLPHSNVPPIRLVVRMYSRERQMNTNVVSSGGNILHMSSAFQELRTFAVQPHLLQLAFLVL